MLFAAVKATALADRLAERQVQTTMRARNHRFRGALSRSLAALAAQTRQRKVGGKDDDK